MTIATPITSDLQTPRKRPQSEPRQFRWTYNQYMQLVKLGMFDRKRVELLGGKIYVMAPQFDRHVASIILCQRAFGKTFGDGFCVRSQSPLQIDKGSAPEPDIAVVPGGPRDYVGTGHPKTALLVVEISDSSLRYDRGKKAARYARAQLADYWIVNLVDRCVEIHRAPIADPSAPLGWRYSKITFHSSAASIAPLAAAQSPVAIADLLP